MATKKTVQKASPKKVPAGKAAAKSTTPPKGTCKK
jgi:hypothetical protein